MSKFFSKIQNPFHSAPCLIEGLEYLNNGAWEQ